MNKEYLKQEIEELKATLRVKTEAYDNFVTKPVRQEFDDEILKRGWEWDSLCSVYKIHIPNLKADFWVCIDEIADCYGSGIWFEDSNINYDEQDFTDLESLLNFIDSNPYQPTKFRLTFEAYAIDRLHFESLIPDYGGSIIEIVEVEI